MPKTYVWIVLAIPAVAILLLYGSDAISYGRFIHLSGQASVALLFITLAVTPLRRLRTGGTWARRLLRHRRALGVATFGYGALHTLVYLERKWGADLILSEGLELPLATGWVALLLFILLAATSNDTSVRRLGRRWKSLHRFVYPATALTFAHWILATFDPRAAWVTLAALLLVESLRIAGRR